MAAQGPVATRTRDFPEDSLGTAAPYGIYDISGNTGWVSVGTDHDTAAFAVESVRRWWNAAADHRGCGWLQRLPHPAWKVELGALAMETGLEITCCHFPRVPPGTSKWNKVEHRLFSAITLN